MKNVVILISGGGSNMLAILRQSRMQRWSERLNARISLVISNRPEAAGLVHARSLGVKAEVIDHRQFSTRDAFDAALGDRIAREAPALVVLAGFMRILTPAFVRRYEDRLINIHPSLLPAFPGLHTHQRALEAGCRFAGATVHRVTAELDHGPILDQAVVPVLPDDTADTLAARVLTQEHRIYPRVIARLLRES